MCSADDSVILQHIIHIVNFIFGLFLNCKFQQKNLFILALNLNVDFFLRSLVGSQWSKLGCNNLSLRNDINYIIHHPTAFLRTA